MRKQRKTLRVHFFLPHPVDTAGNRNFSAKTAIFWLHSNEKLQISDTENYGRLKF